MIIKHFIAITLLLMTISHAYGQKVVGNSGKTISDPSAGSVSFTVGQPIIKLLQGNGGQLTQGFHQPDLVQDIQIIQDPNGISVNQNCGDLTIEFGNLDVDSERILSFAIRNSGNDPLILTQPISIGGPEADAFQIISFPPNSIAPGVTTEVEVLFAPLTDGLKTATLNIVSDDQDEMTCVVNLNGSAAADLPSFKYWSLILFSLLIVSISTLIMYQKNIL